MGYARLFVTIQFYFCSIGKVKIARCDDGVTLMDRHNNAIVYHVACIK